MMSSNDYYKNNRFPQSSLLELCTKLGPRGIHNDKRAEMNNMQYACFELLRASLNKLPDDKDILNHDFRQMGAR